MSLTYYNYQILSSAPAQHLQVKVMEFIQAGWQPIGGVTALVMPCGNIEYAQAMGYSTSPKPVKSAPSKNSTDCACLYNYRDPCSSDCTCAYPYKSGGCLRCGGYGVTANS